MIHLNVFLVEFSFQHTSTVFKIGALILKYE